MTRSTTNRFATNRRNGTSIAIVSTPTSIQIPSPLSIFRKLSTAFRTSVRGRWTAMRENMEPESLCYSRPTLKWHADPKSPEMVEKIAEWNACGDEILDALVLTSTEADIVEAAPVRAPMVARAAVRTTVRVAS